MKKTVTKAITVIMTAIILVGLSALNGGKEVFAESNPYPQYNYFNSSSDYQIACTWYAWKQANERLGLSLPKWGDGGDWYQAADYPKDTSAAVNSIACWSKTNTPKWGHVAYVTGVNPDGSFNIVEGGSKWSGNSFGICSRTVSSGKYWPDQGFIHLACETHKWDSGKVTKKAKCTKSKLIDGKKVFTCTVCGETKTEVIEASHSYKTISTKAATLEKNGSITKKCNKCHKKTTTSIIRPKTIKTKKKLFEYNGKMQKPGVIVKDMKGKAIPRKYYIVSYANNKKIGKAKAIVKFKGRYKGTKILNFTIGPKGSKITKCVGYQKKIKVKWKKTGGVDGYQIQYAIRKDFKSKKSIKIKANKKVTRVISKLKSGKTYYLRIRTYKTVNKKKYYSPWSVVKSVKTKKSTAEDIAGNTMSNIIKYLRTGNVSEVRAYNDKLPEIASESCVNTMSAGMKSAFKKEIQSWENKKTEYSSYYFYDYWLTDLDNDGTAELLLALWPDAAGAETIAYKYENGTLKRLGSVGGMETCHAYPKHNGIVVEGGKMGYNWFKLVTYSNGKLKIEELQTFDFTSGESNINLRNELESHSQWNGEGYVPVYDDLY